MVGGTGFWGDDDATVAPAAVPAVEVAPETVAIASSSEMAEPVIDRRKELLDQISAAMNGIPSSGAMMQTIAGLSEQELTQVSQSMPTLAAAIHAAAIGQDVTAPPIPGAQQIIAEVKKQYEETQAFQNAAMGTLGFGGAAEAGIGAAVIAPLLYATSTTLAPASEVPAPANESGFLDKSGQSKWVPSWLSGLGDHAHNTLNAVTAKFSEIFKGKNPEIQDMSLADLGTLSPMGPGKAKDQSLGIG
jgi:hypothetical protein